MRFSLIQMTECESQIAADQYFLRIGHTIDDYYRKVVVAKATGYGIQWGDKRIGHCMIDKDDRLVQWSLTESYYGLAQDWMRQMLFEERIQAAQVSTREPRFLSLCLEFQTAVSIVSYLFEPSETIGSLDAPIPDCGFVLATAEELGLCKAICGEPYDGYFLNLLEAQGLFVAKLKDEIIGIGELRTDKKAPNQADLGMVTHPKYRRRGIAGFVVANLLKQTEKRGLTANAACNRDNIGSKKTLEKAGMVATHRMLEIQF